jgi:hypothetical protein
VIALGRSKIPKFHFTADILSSILLKKLSVSWADTRKEPVNSSTWGYLVILISAGLKAVKGIQWAYPLTSRFAKCFTFG